MCRQTNSRFDQPKLFDMKKGIFALALGLIMIVPIFVTADESEVEILLVEVMGTLPGDDPLDGHGQSGVDPTHPNPISNDDSGTIFVTIPSVISSGLYYLHLYCEDEIVQTKLYIY